MNTPPRSFAAPPPSPPADGDKPALRAQARARRRELHRALPDAAVQAAQAYARAGCALARVVALYLPQGAELDPWPLAAVLERRGAVVVLPVAVAPDAPLAFRRPRPGAPYAPDAAGVPAPGPDAEALRPDLVVCPCLAFDRTGARLGQGGGYYDRTLAALRASGPAVFALGLAYAGQEVERLPTAPHDARLDAVLSEAGLLQFGTPAP